MTVDRSQARIEFGRAILARRTRAGLSQREICRICRIATGQYCGIEKGRVACLGRNLRRVCSVLGIQEAAAWELRLTGRLGRAVTLDEASRICDMLGVDQRLPDRLALIAKRQPMLECRMCGKGWKQRSTGPPRVCSRCHSRYWRTATPAERRLHKHQGARSLAGWRKRKGTAA